MNLYNVKVILTQGPATLSVEGSRLIKKGMRHPHSTRVKGPEACKPSSGNLGRLTLEGYANDSPGNRAHYFPSIG